MQRLRTTFKRSRTPTGAEMKTQSSLEVPKQVRSASFDEIQLEAKRALQHQSSESSGFLSVPSQSQRSKSFDGGGGGGGCEDPGMFLEVPRGRFQRRRSSGDKSPPICVHCIYMEEYWRLRTPPGEEAQNPRSFSYSDTSTEEDIDSDPEPPLDPDLEPPPTPLTPQCCITVTLSPNPDVPPAFEEPPSPSTRRRSITSPKLERQEAFIFNENLLEPPSPDEPLPTPVPNDLIVNEFFLAVPELKRDRAASVDSCFINKSAGKTEEIEPPPSATLLLEPPPLGPNALRSRSVDIVLPTDTQARYKALAMTNTSTRTTIDKGKAVQGGGGGGADAGSEAVQRTIRSTPDWSEGAVNGDHLWSPTNASGDFCYVGEGDCTTF